MGFIDKILQKLSTKDPDKVAKGDTVFDGWYMMGKEGVIEKEQTKAPISKKGEKPEK
ncbi:MAG: hypothetical protein LBO03_05120 [Acidaminococcales bacterium]|jgi:hypothetical protein|nr:hypothetical protein [Acidaminococcales bacterium]